MKKGLIKKFIGERSKLALLVYLISILIFIFAVVPQLLSYSSYISMISDNPISYGIGILTDYEELDYIIVSLLSFIVLFNIVGYFYNKSEFMFISTGLYIVVFCIGFYVIDVLGLVLIALLLILNLFGYLDQVSIKK